jgi:hypothetical protein
MTERARVFGAFDQGQTPTIACFNQAKTPLGLDLKRLVPALQKFVDTCVVPVWGTPANLVESTGFIPGAWAIVFLDVADAPGALAYHDLTPDGFPLSKVFVKTILDDNASLSVATSHELVEMLVDPAINLWTVGPQAGTFYAYESADPVEEESFSLDGFDMTDFVYPSYFEDFHKPGATQLDYLKKVQKPFQILKGGYQIIFRKGKESQVFGSVTKKKRFAKEDRRGHRSESRGVAMTNSSCRRVRGHYVHDTLCRSRPNPGRVLS